jgi:ribosomal subunit interface protein
LPTGRYIVEGRWRVTSAQVGASVVAARKLAEEFMELQLQITTRELAGSQALEDKIRDKAEKLAKLYDHIVSLHVVVDSPERRHHKGKLYNCRIHLLIPGDEIVVTHESDVDPYVSVRDAFDAAKRRLQDHVDRKRGR